MNVSSILNSTRPISLYEKEKETRDTSFLDALAQAAKEAAAQVTEYTASAEEIEAIEASKPNGCFNPSYTLTDEEAEYFREKYGEDYNEENLKDFFFELSEKGIIHDSDAISTTGIGYIRSVEVIGNIPPGASAEEMMELVRKGLLQFKMGEKQFAKSRDIFQKEYEDFKQDHTYDIITWKDYMQEQLDFYEYLKNRDTIYDAEGKQRPNNRVYDKTLEGLERTADVIKQIFG